MYTCVFSIMIYKPGWPLGYVDNSLTSFRRTLYTKHVERALMANQVTVDISAGMFRV